MMECCSLHEETALQLGEAVFRQWEVDVKVLYGRIPKVHMSTAGLSDT
jgi:hypothetical protein